MSMSDGRCLVEAEPADMVANTSWVTSDGDQSGSCRGCRDLVDINRRGLQRGQGSPSQTERGQTGSRGDRGSAGISQDQPGSRGISGLVWLQSDEPVRQNLQLDPQDVPLHLPRPGSQVATRGLSVQYWSGEVGIFDTVPKRLQVGAGAIDQQTKTLARD